LGERVCLSVVPSGYAAPPPVAELLRHLFDLGLSKYDMPEYFLSMTEFPLTASGKILKRELAQWAKIGKIIPLRVRFEAQV